jgi:hypothetical protein
MDRSKLTITPSGKDTGMRYPDSQRTPVLESWQHFVLQVTQPEKYGNVCAVPPAKAATAFCDIMKLDVKELDVKDNLPAGWEKWSIDETSASQRVLFHQLVYNREMGPSYIWWAGAIWLASFKESVEAGEISLDKWTLVLPTALPPVRAPTEVKESAIVEEPSAPRPQKVGGGLLRT